nr:PREDICTED: uncharacterized protein LOC109559907 isoform X2 [Bos indicus]
MGQGLCSRGRDSAAPAASERDPPARAELQTSAPQARSGSRRLLRTVPSRCEPGRGWPPLPDQLGDESAVAREPSVWIHRVPARLSGTPHSFAQTDNSFGRTWLLQEHLQEAGRLSWPSEDAPAPCNHVASLCHVSGWQGSPGGLVPPPRRLGPQLAPGARMTVPPSGQGQGGVAMAGLTAPRAGCWSLPYVWGSAPGTG